jgi:NADH-quinone oxidoreductase subunit L
VLGANYAVLFVGWEGVGLCSYLLIGFWFEDPLKARAGQKAFVVNRIGDLGLLLGMLMYFVHFGTLGFAGEARQAVVNLLPDVDAVARTAIALLLFVGAVGKSAQIPLQIWLPDAMAGPTPVSALIHAATMVTAGVYLVARMNFLYAYAPVAGAVIAVVGAATALMAGLAAIPQRDIKRSLAYSTISQLGLMFLAAGLGAYTAALFHLVTHAFFKALLFLGAGAAIHALGGEQDLFRMGGLRRPLPIVFWTMTAGVLALAGAFPFAGFWSKEEILLGVYEQSQNARWLLALWGVGLATSLCTAFYGVRLLCLAFLAPDPKSAGGAPGSNGPERAGRSLHRPGFAMQSVLGILAVLSFLGGALGIPHGGAIAQFLKPVWLVTPVSDGRTAFMSPALWNAALTLFLVLVSGGIAWYLYTAGRRGLQAWIERRPLGRWIHAWAAGGFGFDRFYEGGLVRLLRTGSFLLWLVADVLFIDGLCVHGPAALVRRMGEGLRRLQSGLLSHYASILTIGAILVVGYLIGRMAPAGLFRALGL